MNESYASPNCIRRLTTYSLRTLFVALTMTAICFGLVTERARRQKAVIEELQEIRAVVYYDYQLRNSDSITNGKPCAFSGFLGIDYCHNAVSVRVHDPMNAVQVLPLLKRLPRLKKVIYCWNNGASEQTLARFKRELDGIEIAVLVAVVG